MFKCMMIYRRSGDIIELQEGTISDTAEDACSPGKMNENYLPFTILLSKLGSHSPPRSLPTFEC